MISLLEKLGLSQKEAKVYLSALELGAESVQNIAKKAGVNRVTTYVVLESLKKIGLISSYEKGKKTYFTAENPEQLDRLLKNQEEEIEKKRSDLAKSIPELQAIFNLSGSKPKVKFYEGKEGIKALREDSWIESGKSNTVYAFTNLDNYLETYPEQETVRYRIKKKAKLFVIYTKQSGPVVNATDSQQKRIARFVPKNKFPFESTINIYPNLVSIYNFKPQFNGILIKGANIAKTFKAIFDLSWESAKKYN